MPTLMIKHLPTPALDLERALEIVGAINDRMFLAMGLVPASEVGSLQGVSLVQMLEAKQVVERENDRRAAEAKREGSSYSISVVPADRLIAAAYALENYEAGDGHFVMMPEDISANRFRTLNIGWYGWDVAGGAR